VWLNRGPPNVAHDTRAMGLLRLLTAALGTSLHSRPCNFLADIGPTSDITGL
jgi:hypothetical protein